MRSLRPDIASRRGSGKYASVSAGPRREDIIAASGTFLLGDIGGTNARFALLADGKLSPIAILAVADHGGIDDAIGAFFARDSNRPAIGGAVLGIAGPIEDECGRITNSGWTIDGAALRARFGFATVRLHNDFETLAHALPVLAGADLHPLGGGHAAAGAPMVVLGPGTGLGVAALIPGPGGPVAIATEGGHADMAGASPREDAVLAHLRERFGHVSAERVISGPGLENLYEAIAALDGTGTGARSAPDITQSALDGSSPSSRAALDMFCALLGAMAGNLALTFGAHGGVFIGGGIAPRMLDYLARSEFRERFTAKGRFRSYLEAIPTQVIVNPNASFLGLKEIAQRAG